MIKILHHLQSFGSVLFTPMPESLSLLASLLSLATVLQWLGFSQVSDLGFGSIEGYMGLGKSAVLYYVYNSNQGSSETN